MSRNKVTEVGVSCCHRNSIDPAHYVALAKKIILFHLRNEKRLELTRDLPDMGKIT